MARLVKLGENKGIKNNGNEEKRPRLVKLSNNQPEAGLTENKTTGQTAQEEKGRKHVRLVKLSAQEVGTQPATLSEAIAEQWKAQAAEKKAETTSTPVQTEQEAEPYRGPAWAQEMAGRYRPTAADLAKRDARTGVDWRGIPMEYSPDKKPEATVKDWAGLAGNTLMAGVGQIDKAATATLSAAEQLITRPLGALLGNPELYKSGLFYVSDQEVTKAENQVQEDLAGSAEKTGKAGELIAQFGPATVAALPQAALAYLTAGHSEAEAMRIADHYGREVMGSRAKGPAPLAFQSKNVFNRMIHAFQLEALNTWEHISQDLPRDYRDIAKDKGKNAAARALAGTVLKILVGNFLHNRASEMLYGGTPAQGDVFGIIGNFVASGAGTTLNAVTISALKKIINAGWEKVMGEKLFDDDDDEDEEERPFDLAEAAKSAGSDALNDTPILKNAGALFGVGDLTLPMPDLANGVKKTIKAYNDYKEDGEGGFPWEVARQLMGLAGDVVPGGRQAEKTFQGLDTALRGGRFSGYGEKEKLMYPVDEDPFTALRAALFGNSALEETGEYYASGNKALSEEQTKVYKEAVAAGGSRKEIYNAILDWRNVNGDEDLTSEEKARLGEEIVGETDLSDREKLKFYKGLNPTATARAEQLEALLNAGLDWDGAIGAYAMYDEIKRREGMTAGEKATAFARWADETYPAKQAGPCGSSSYTTPWYRPRRDGMTSSPARGWGRIPPTGCRRSWALWSRSRGRNRSPICRNTRLSCRRD